MRISVPSRKLLTVILAVIAFCVATSVAVRHRYTPVATHWDLLLTSVNPTTRSVGPEEIGPTAPLGEFEVSGSFTYQGRPGAVLRLIPDDCLRSLTINGVQITPAPSENWCDWGRGFTRPAEALVVEGSNSFTARLENRGGPRRLGFEVLEPTGEGNALQKTTGAIKRWRATSTTLTLTRAVKPDETERSDVRGPFIISGTFTYQGDSTETLRIVPDDCLEALKINDQTVQLPEGDASCNTARGIEVSTAHLIRQGRNTIEARIVNRGGPRAWSFIFERSSLLGLTTLPLLVLAVGWTLFLMRLFSLRGVSAISFSAFTILSLAYLYVTPPSQRTYDVFEGGGHADYIAFVAEKGDLPPMGKGWEYHQPPLYYVLAANLYRHFAPYPNDVPWEIMQGFSWVLFQLFVVIGLIFVRENTSGKMAATGSLLFALWPMNIVHAARIGNDVMLYVFAVAGILYLSRWLRSASLGDLVCASGYIALACFVKSTGLPLVAVTFSILLIESARAWRRGSPRSLRGHLRAIGIALVSLVLAAISLAPKMMTAHGGNPEHLLFPGITANHGLRIKIGIENFIPWGITEHWEAPFTSPWRDDWGRRNFWLYLFKTSLSGELSSNQPVVLYLSTASLWIGFLIATLGIVGFVREQRTQSRDWVFYAALCFWCPAILVVTTLAQPHACNHDFRYIYYLLPVLTVLAVRGLSLLPRGALPIVSGLSVLGTLSGTTALLLLALQR